MTRSSAVSAGQPAIEATCALRHRRHKRTCRAQLLATADRADKDHHACRALLEGDAGPLVATGLVIGEARHAGVLLASGAAVPVASLRPGEKVLATNLKTGKLAVAEEGAERAAYALKLPSSGGKLPIAGTGKDTVTGRLVTHTYTVTGPAAISPTTTATDADILNGA